MKCIQCGRDSKLKERADGRCPGCGQEFAFNPPAGDLYTDQAFANAIDRVSAGGNIIFTERNLFFELNRRLKRPTGALITTGVFAAVGAGLALASAGGVALLPLAGAAAAGVVAMRRHLLRADVGPSAWAAFQRHLHRWELAHGVPRALFRPRVSPPPTPSSALEAELKQYSFDRAVITDNDETADLLLANNFHFENNCAVLSISGHPAYAFPIVREMLRRNPRIEVYALHDCTPRGCTLAWTLREDPAWFKGIGRVFDVALRPAQAENSELRRSAGSGTVAPHPAYTEKERAFLVRHSVELAAMRPEQVVKRLFRSMTVLPTAAAAPDWNTTAVASDGGADAFG